MKGLLFLTFILFFQGCKREESVTPFSKSVDYRDGIRKTFTVRYPLMPDQVGSYSYGDVLEIDPNRRNVLQAITQPFKRGIYDLGVRLLNRNKVQAQADFSIPSETFEYLKSVRLKRIFIVLDSCVDKSRRCVSTVQGVEKTFISEVFINLEPYKEGTVIQEFREVDDATFLQKASEFVSNFGKRRRTSSKGFQVASYRSRKRSHNPNLSNYYVFKHNKELTKLENHLKQSVHVEKTTLFGDLILAELKKLPNSNISRIVHNQSFHKEFKNQYRYINPAPCSKGNCTELEINSENILDYLKDNRNVIVNTFIKVNKLPRGQFHYKGFIEFDVELNI